MKYQTAAAFRTALEARLLLQSRERNLPLTRLRKLVVFDRLLARLVLVAPGKWTIKGGVALIYRLGDDARTTRDLDLARQGHASAATNDMMVLGSVHLDDYFSFTVAQVPAIETADKGAVVRFRVLTELDGRRFEQITVDIGFDLSFENTSELLMGPSLLAFAGLPPFEVPAVPLERHIAEKLHAYSRIHAGNRVNTRVRDLVDIILIASFANFRMDRLRTAIKSTFVGRSAQQVPTSLPPPPTSWRSQYHQLASEVALNPDVDEGYKLAAAFFDPVLQGVVTTDELWQPVVWAWSASPGE